jgi:hypothetical protein
MITFNELETHRKLLLNHLRPEKSFYPLNLETEGRPRGMALHTFLPKLGLDEQPQR